MRVPARVGRRRARDARTDALADIAYVAYGAAVTYGIDFDAALREVHRSNMSKELGKRPFGREFAHLDLIAGRGPIGTAILLADLQRGVQGTGGSAWTRCRMRHSCQGSGLFFE